MNLKEDIKKEINKTIERLVPFKARVNVSVGAPEESASTGLVAGDVHIVKELFKHGNRWMAVIEEDGKEFQWGVEYFDKINSLSLKEKRKLCVGCEDNFYNSNNNLGIENCWSLEGSKLCKKKEVHINDTPPWTHQPVIDTLDCFKRKQYVYVGPERTN